MNTVLWIITGVLAVAFLAAGLFKLTQPKAALMAAGQGWVEDFNPALIKGIGVLEIAGATGLVLPAVLDIAPVLVPIAAVCLGLTMVGAAATHLRRKELPMMASNLVLLIGCVVVAWGRFGPHAF